TISFDAMQEAACRQYYIINQVPQFVPSVSKSHFLSVVTMVATAATSAFHPVASPQSDSGAKTSGKLGGVPANVDARGIKSKSAAARGCQVKANAQAPPKSGSWKVSRMRMTWHHLRQELLSTNCLTGACSLLLSLRFFLAAEKQWMMLDWKPKRPDALIDPFGLGKIVQDGLVFRQNFSIRSYEIGADRTASIETLMNHLQETALNHVKTAGLLDGGFGSTPEMCKKNLIWVVTKMQLLFEGYSFGNKLEHKAEKFSNANRRLQILLMGASMDIAKWGWGRLWDFYKDLSKDGDGEPIYRYRDGTILFNGGWVRIKIIHQLGMRTGMGMDFLSWDGNGYIEYPPWG
ncbi:unnamed protein product, partial [Thlaspi arvense]